MAEPAERTDAAAHAARMDTIYRRQRHIYDATRKYYLLGRDRLIRGLAVPPAARVLELGCGTGRNLALIGRLYPEARLFGLDISAVMLESAARSLAGGRQATLVRGDAAAFDAVRDFGQPGFERIVLSYTLSMIPPWRETIGAALAALTPGGSLHIVDFGQQAHLPAAFRTGLHAWLARFDVTPRADLLEVATEAAACRGMLLSRESLYRDYAWHIRVDHPGACSDETAERTKCGMVKLSERRSV